MFLNENLHEKGFWGKENNSDIKIQNNKVIDSYNVIITWGKPLKYHKVHRITSLGGGTSYFPHLIYID